MKSEPALLVSTVTAFLTAIIGLGVAFGLDLSDDQRNAIIGAVAPAALVIALLGPIIRSLVYSPETTEDISEEAFEAGRAGNPVKPRI